jgi:hypothetical protein
MKYGERRRAQREGRTPRTLREIDYLLLVDDEARQGALHFAAEEGGPFLAAPGVSRIPPLEPIREPSQRGGQSHLAPRTPQNRDSPEWHLNFCNLFMPLAFGIRRGVVAAICIVSVYV